MKLRKIVYGVLCMGALASCSDQMNYHEYNNNSSLKIRQA